MEKVFNGIFWSKLNKIFSLFLHPFKYGLKDVIPAKIRHQGCLEMNHKTTVLQGTKLYNGN